MNDLNILSREAYGIWYTYLPLLAVWIATIILENKLALYIKNNKNYHLPHIVIIFLETRCKKRLNKKEAMGLAIGRKERGKESRKLIWKEEGKEENTKALIKL